MANKLAPYKDKVVVEQIKKFSSVSPDSYGGENIMIIENDEYADTVLYFNYLMWLTHVTKVKRDSLENVLNKSQFLKVWAQHIKPFL